MKRPIMGMTVNQRTSDEYFQLSSIEGVSTVLRHGKGLPPFHAQLFLNQKGCKAFVASLEAKLGKPAIVSTGRGRGHHTWVHPYVMLKIALAMSPELEVEVYGWIYDELIKYRGESCESYKKMCGALALKFQKHKHFLAFITDAANQVRNACSVGDDWNEATEAQLKLRDKIHDTISILSDVIDEPRDAVRLGIIRALGENKPKPLPSWAKS